ncbi:hypothetical protein B0H13DRAFT_52467 [Mycena leptocephala]|nr:hypothetical protein B0H13DRAFT_52467 [Mycena leptocephala]
MVLGDRSLDVVLVPHYLCRFLFAAIHPYGHPHAYISPSIFSTSFFLPVDPSTTLVGGSIYDGHCVDLSSPAFFISSLDRSIITFFLTSIPLVLQTPIRLTLSFTTHPFPSNPLLRWKLYRPSPPSSGSFRPVAGAFPAANADSVPSGSSFPAFNGNGSGSRPSTGTRGSRRSQRSSARQPFDAEVDAELDVNAAHLGRSRRGGWS